MTDKRRSNSSSISTPDSIGAIVGDDPIVFFTSQDNSSSGTNASLLNELNIMRRRMRQIDKRLSAIETHLETADQTLIRLRDFLDKQAVRDARETNRALRSGVPMPFQASHTTNNVCSATGSGVLGNATLGTDASTIQTSSPYANSSFVSPLYAPLMMPSMAARFWPARGHCTDKGTSAASTQNESNLSNPSDSE